MGALSGPLAVCSILSFFGGVLALAVATLKSMTEDQWAPVKFGHVLQSFLGFDPASVRGISSPELQQVLLYVLNQPLWIVLFALGILLILLSKFTSTFSR